MGGFIHRKEILVLVAMNGIFESHLVTESSLLAAALRLTAVAPPEELPLLVLTVPPRLQRGFAAHGGMLHTPPSD